MLQIAWKHQKNGHRRWCENSHWQISAPGNKTGRKFISKLALNHSWNLPHFMMSSLFFQYFTGLWQLQMTLSLILADISRYMFLQNNKLFLLILSNLADLMGPFFIWTALSGLFHFFVYENSWTTSTTSYSPLAVCPSDCHLDSFHHAAPVAHTRSLVTIAHNSQSSNIFA